MEEQSPSTMRPAKYVRSIILIMKEARFSRNKISMKYGNKYKNSNYNASIPANSS